MAEATFHSQILLNERRLWVLHPSADRAAEAICILLDGEYYVERMNAPTLLAELQASGAIPSMWLNSINSLF
jgi:enterochelin esterase-like enzyme